MVIVIKCKSASNTGYYFEICFNERNSMRVLPGVFTLPVKYAIQELCIVRRFYKKI